MNLVEVIRISYYPPSKGFAVLLKEKEGVRHLQILVDSAQAQAIALYLESVNMPRPMTHDVLVNILENLDGEINRVLIARISKGTFLAEIEIYSPNSGEMIIDSRPSDAIAIALRTLAPIYISDEVMEVASIENLADENEISNVVTSKELSGELSGELSEELVLENLNEALEKAIRDEEYELAARLRDRIKQLEKKSIS